MGQIEEYHINNSTIKIIFGNILDSQAEVIVSSDDCNISMGGGVSMAIRCKEGTDAIRQDVKKMYLRILVTLLCLRRVHCRKRIFSM